MELGIDLRGTNVRIGRLEEGKPIEKITVPSPAHLDMGDSLFYMKQFVSILFKPEVTGIGIGVPSVVDLETGEISEDPDIAILGAIALIP